MGMKEAPVGAVATAVSNDIRFRLIVSKYSTFMRAFAQWSAVDPTSRFTCVQILHGIEVDLGSNQASLGLNYFHESHVS